MRQDDTSTGWEIGQEVNYQRPVPRPATPHAAELRSDPAACQIPVLARLPDLDAPQPAPRQRSGPRRSSSRASGDGRLISQALSMKLLAGGAVLLVVLAVVPWMFGGKKGQTDDQAKQAELPAWQQDAPPARDGSPPQFNPSARPQNHPPQELAETQPARPASGGPAFEAPRAPGAPPPVMPGSLPPNTDQHASTATEAAGAPGWPAAPPATSPGPAEWPQLPQTPVVHVPAHEPFGNPHPNATMPNHGQAQAMQPMQIQSPPAGMGPPAANGQMSYDRYPRPQAPAPQYHPGGGYPSTPAGPVLPNGWDSGVGPALPSPAAEPPMMGQPGVANFQGIIESPPVRTTNDYTRPGVY